MFYKMQRGQDRKYESILSFKQDKINIWTQCNIISDDI